MQTIELSYENSWFGKKNNMTVGWMLLAPVNRDLHLLNFRANIVSFYF